MTELRLIDEDKVWEMVDRLRDDFDTDREFRVGQVDLLFQILEGRFDAEGEPNPSYDQNFLDDEQYEVLE